MITLPPHLARLKPLVVPDLVRLGSKLDGGYVVPRSVVLAADGLVSFGLGTDWTFERDVARLHPGIAIHVYDHTVDERSFLEGIVSVWRNEPPKLQAPTDVGSWVELYESYREFFQGKRVHFRQRVADRAAHTTDVTPDQVFARLSGCQDMLLKMDIEGAEYRVLEALLAHQERIALMVVEFHATDFLRKVFLTKLERLCEHYEIVHLHGNNIVGVAGDGLPDVLEITFLKRALCGTDALRRHRLPLPGLDFPNDPARPDYELAFD